MKFVRNNSGISQHTLFQKSFIGSAICLLSGVAMAQSTAQTPARSAVLEEVIVTAERREAGLQETPISVAVMGEMELQAIGAFEASQVADYIPNIRINKQPGSQSNLGIAIRGVAAVETALTTDPAVGLYVDGVYLGRSTGAAFDIVDLQRIEVLRGPQGTLYGRNSTGGAINLVTKRPMGEFGFTQALTYGERGFFRSTTSVDTPKFGDFAAKLSYHRSQHDGNVKSLYTGDDLGEYKSDAARAALRWTPTENFTADYVFDWSKRRENNQTSQISHVRPFHIGVGGPFYQQLAAVSSPDRLSALPLRDNRSNEGTSDVNGHALTLEWNLGDVTLKSITSYREWEGLARGTSFGMVPVAANTVLNGPTGTFIPAGEFVSAFSATRFSEQDQITQEFQLLGTALNDRLNYTAGVYFFHEEAFEFNPQQFVLPAIVAFGQQPLPVQQFLCQGQGPGACIGKSVRLGNPDFAYTVDNDAVAAYGQATYSLTPQFDVTLGARISKDWKEASLTTNFSDLGGVDTIKDSTTWTNFSPMMTLSYQWTPDINTYFTASSAFRSGGYNARATTVSSFTRPADEEEIISYELGLKSELWDRRARLNAALFYMDYTDRQITQFESGSGGASSRVVNAGESTAQGVEIDLTLLPTEGLLLQANYGYLKIDFDSFVTGISDPITGFPQGEGEIKGFASTNLHAPEHTAALIAQYTFPAASFGTLVARADMTYADNRSFHNQLNRFDSVSAHRLLNGRMTLREIPVERGNLEVGLWGRNLTNEKVREFGIDFGALGFAINTYRELRSVGLDARYEF